MMKLCKALFAGLTLLGALSASSLAVATTTDATVHETGVSIVEYNAAQKDQLDRAGFPQYAQ